MVNLLSAISPPKKKTNTASLKTCKNPNDNLLQMESLCQRSNKEMNENNFDNRFLLPILFRGKNINYQKLIINRDI